MVGASVTGDALVVDLRLEHRCLSSAVLGGGLGRVRTWLNAQVPDDYARMDPAEHLREISSERRLPGPVVGMLTAALVRDHASTTHGLARTFATVGVRDALAAAGEAPVRARRTGTINVLVVLGAPLTDAALVAAVATATEAKVQALAEAGVPASNGLGTATGTATDSICVACPDVAATAPLDFAGTATPVGRDIARSVHCSVLDGTERYLRRRAANEGA